MGEDIRFARNSQKNIRELIRKQEQAQLELATVLTELHGDAATIVPKNKNLLKKLNTASFAMRELQNNWNSLEFAFQHLMVPQNPPVNASDRSGSQNSNSQKSDGTKPHVRSGTTQPPTAPTQSTTPTSHVKNENNNLHLKRKTAINCNESPMDVKKEPKLEPKVEPEIEPDDESEGDSEESEAESAFDPRRSPRIRQNSVRTDSGRSTPIKEQKSPKMKKSRKRKNSKNGVVKNESKSSESISPTLIPKRESLRRVLELSKRTFEDQNNEKDTGNTTGSQSDTSDAESDADSEPEENEKSTSDEQDNETPKIKLKNVPTPTKIRSETTNPKTESTDAQKVKKERKLKTDPRVLARQRESYHKRKQRRQSNEIIGSGSETNPSSGKQHTPNGGSQPEKGKPWCNVPNRKTPTHILQRRRDAYYRRKEQKLFETNGQSKPSDSPLQPKEEKKKSLKKIEAKPKPTSSLNGAITPIKPITTSFVKMTIIPPVYSQSQLETLKSLDQLNQPGLVLLPSPQPQLLNGTSTKPKTERSYVKIEKNTKPKNETPERKFEPPKKRKWDDRTKGIVFR